MKTKSLLLAVGLLVSGALLTAQILAPASVTIAIDTLLDRAALNRNTARALAPLSDYAAGYFYGKAAAQEEIAAQQGMP